jgi:hypothetical protein
MAENRAKCSTCGATLTRLIRVRFRSLISFFFNFIFLLGFGIVQFVDEFL